MQIDKRLFIGLFFSFILATVVGTVTHECGHYIVAKMLGYDAHVDYMSTWIAGPKRSEPLSGFHWFLFTLGGPIETLLTGTIGIILLIIYRRRFYTSSALSVRQWIIVFVSLFWLRPVANFVVWIGNYFYTGGFSKRADEIKIARYMALPGWSVSGITALAGAVVLGVVCFRFIPIAQRTTFIVSGLAGGVAGYLLWLVFLGKYIMP